MAAAAAGLGSQLVSRSGDALAQTAALPLPPDNGLFPGFEARWVHTNGADIFVRHGGTGQPLLLLHGNPQSHVCWHKVAGAPSPGGITSSPQTCGATATVSVLRRAAQSISII